MGKRSAKPTVTPELSVVCLHGASREIYGFTPFPLDAAPALSGVYAFAAQAEAEDGNAFHWRIMFVGEAADIAAAATSHSMAAAKRDGASRLLVHICGRDEDYRRFIEDDLAAALAPPLNALQRRAAA